MKTKMIISKARFVAQVAAILALVLSVTVYALPQQAFHTLMQKLWPFAAVLIVFYAVLTLSEDYANSRILRPRC